jgi:glutathione synthetase
MQNGNCVNGTHNSHHANKVHANTYVVEQLADKNVTDLTKYAVDYAHCEGVLCRTQEHKYESDVSETAPITLLPSPFPAELYETAVSLQQMLNELYFRIAMDHEFLIEAYKDVMKTDEFMRRSIEIMEKVRAEGVHRKILVSVQRADYLSDYDSETKQCGIKQVEVNLGQIGGPGHAYGTSKVHRRVLDKLERLNHSPITALSHTVAPENHPHNGLAKTLYEAWKLFGDPNAVVLFLNQSDLFPVCHFEQAKFVVFQLEDLARAEGYHLNVVRATITDCVKRLHLDEKDFSIYIDGERVALVHMAYGYSLEHYLNEAEWKTRLDLERSTALLSPDITVQLAGSKKVQQMLAQPGTLERFLPNEKPSQLAKLRQCYAGIWGLDSTSPETMAAVNAAMKNPSQYVLKSQQEAGKGNFFDEEIPQMLTSMSADEKAAFILQKKINSIVVKNYMVRPLQAPRLEDVISEVSIYGTLIGDSKTGQMLRSETDGYLVRTKPASANQGGVTAGTGVIDSVLLFPAEQFTPNP